MSVTAILDPHASPAPDTLATIRREGRRGGVLDRMNASLDRMNSLPLAIPFFVERALNPIPLLALLLLARVPPFSPTRQGRILRRVLQWRGRYTAGRLLDAYTDAYTSNIWCYQTPSPDSQARWTGPSSPTFTAHGCVWNGRRSS